VRGRLAFHNRLDADSSAFLALGTGNVERAARMKLEHVGLNPFFPVGGFGDDAEERKEAIADAVRNATLHYQRSFAPELSWVIGDTPYDIEAGRALGLRTLAVATGGLHTIDDLRYAAPDVVLENLSDTERVLRAIELEK
jgi:phosphoglycolate phosphatase-like HAD superfamily hydrolase